MTGRDATSSASAKLVSTRILVDDLDTATAAWAAALGLGPADLCKREGELIGPTGRVRFAERMARVHGDGYALELVEVSRGGEVWRRRDGTRRHSIGVEIEDLSGVSAALEARGYPAVVRGIDAAGRAGSFVFHESPVGGLGLRLAPISAAGAPTDAPLPVFHTGTVVDDLPRAMRDLSQVFGLGFAAPMKMAGELRGPDGPTYRETLITFSLPGPHRIELIQMLAGDIWDPPGGPRVHHLGVWSENLVEDSARMEAVGFPRRVTGPGEPADRPHHIAFHPDPHSGIWIELVDVSNRPHLARWLEGGALDVPGYAEPPAAPQDPRTARLHRGQEPGTRREAR